MKNVNQRKFAALIADATPTVFLALDNIRELHFKHYGDGQTFDQFVEGVGLLLKKFGSARELSIQFHYEHLIKNDSDKRYPLLCIALAYLERTQHAKDQAKLDKYVALAKQNIDCFNSAVEVALPEIDQAREPGPASRSSNKLVRVKVIELVRTRCPPTGWPSKSAAYRGILEPLQEFIADHNAKHDDNQIRLSEDNLERRLQEWSLAHDDIAAALKETMSPR